MKKFHTLIIFSFTAAFLATELPARGSDDADKISVSFQGDMCAMNPFTISLNGSSASGSGDDCGQYWGSNTATTHLVPEQQYTLQISGGVCTGHVTLSESSSCYDLYVNGSKGSSISSGDGSPGSGDGSWTIELKAPQEGGSPGNSGGGIGSYHVYADLGSLPNGHSAGSLVVNGDVIPSGGFTLSDLRFTGPDPGSVSAKLQIIDDAGELVDDFYRSIDATTIRQVMTDTVLADAVFNAEEDRIEIRFYEVSGSVSRSASGFYDTSDSGLAAISRTEIRNITPSEFQLAVVNGSRTTTQRFAHDSDTDAWTKSSGSEAVTLAKKETGSGASYKRVETRTFKVRDEDEAWQTVRTIQKTYKAVQTGVQVDEEQNTNPIYDDRLVLRRVDPGGADEQTTVFKYYDPASAPDDSFKWGNLEYKVDPDGTWEKYDYAERNARNRIQPGMPAKVYRPWGDSPNLPTQATDTNCHLTEHAYVNFWNDDRGANELSSTETSILGETTGKTTYEYSQEGRYLGYPIRQSAIQKVVRREYSDTNNYLETVTKTYNPRHPDWPGRPFADQEPSGRAVSYAYEKGNWDSSTKTFTVSSTGTAIRVSRVNGSWKDAEGEEFTEINGLDNSEFEDIYLVANKSTKTEQILAPSGRICYEANHVFTGNGDNWALLDWKEHQYTSAAEIERTDYSNGTYYEANWENGRKTWESAIEGIKTRFTYDEQGRIETETIDGVDGVVGPVSKVYFRDEFDSGCGCLTGVRINKLSSGHTDTLTTYRELDKAGRVKATREESGVVTRYAYTGPAITLDDNFEVTAITGYASETQTIPGGRSKTTTRYRDGQVKSIAGNAVVNQYHSYATADVDGIRHIESRITLGSASGPRWTETRTDWLDRQVQIKKPSFLSRGFHQTTLAYEEATGLLAEKQASGLAPELYEYDTAGRLHKHGHDIGGTSGVLDHAADRFTEFAQNHVNESGNWYYQEARTRYLKDGSSGEKEVVVHKRQLTGLDAGDGFAEVQINQTTFHEDGETTTRTARTNTTIDRTAKTVIATTTQPGGSMQEVKTVNGYRTGTKTHLPGDEDFTVTLGYDALGRLTSRSDTAGHTSTTRYLADSSLVHYTETSETGRTTYTYHETGEVKSIQNAAGQYTYFAYHTGGQILRKWGDAVYPVRYSYNEYHERTGMWTYRDGKADFDSADWPAARDSGGDRTQWVFDAASGLLHKKIDPARKETGYDYYVEGRLKRRTWARTVPGDGASEPDVPLYTGYTYDSDTGELTDIDYSDDSTDIAYTYDRAGRLRTITDASGARTLAYRSGILQSETYASGPLSGIAIERSIDASTRVDGLTVSDDSATLYSLGYEYDDASRLEELAFGSHTATYAYKPGTHQIRDITLADAEDQAVFSRHQTYRRGRLLQSVEARDADGTAIARTTYTHDARGRRTKRTALDGSYWKYAYNSRSEVESGIRHFPDG